MMPEEFSQPAVSMQVEKGVFKVRGSVKVDGADPETVHAIVRDHEASARVFKGDQRVDVVERAREHVIVTQHSQWKFLFWSGVYSVTLRFMHDPIAHTSSFRLERPGLIKRFDGYWTITADVPPNDKFRQEIQLAMTPPAPFARFGGQIMMNQVKGVLHDIVSEALKLRMI